MSQIKRELSETDSTYDTEKLSERIAKLAGGVAVIKVSRLNMGEVMNPNKCIMNLIARVLPGWSPCKNAAAAPVHSRVQASVS